MTGYKGVGLTKFLIISAVFVVVAAVVSAIAGFAYWQSLKDEPQHALASIVDASRRNDNAAINELIDSDAVVDSLVPQITEKAVEIYGRGLPNGLISQIAVAASPLSCAGSLSAQTSTTRPATRASRAST